MTWKPEGADVLEVWVTILGPDGDPITEPLPAVMEYVAGGQYASTFKGTWKLLEGRDQLPPSGMRIKFADGREVDGELP